MRMNGDQEERARKMVAVQMPSRPLFLARYARSLAHFIKRIPMYDTRNTFLWN